MDRDEEKDLYIKAKLKDGHIPEKIDNLFNNSAKLIENIEPPKKNKNQIIWKRVAGIAACAVIVLGGGNIYATTQGYDNVFFMIKEWVAPSDDAHGKDEILSDRDITISYKSIEIAKGIKMQINRLVVTDDDAKLYLKIDQSETKLDITPFTYVVRDEKGNEICNYTSKNEKMTYVEELNLDGFKKNIKKLELEVKQSDESTLVKFDIDIENKEIQVIGNEYELQKISEEELKKYLSAFALLNYEDEELNLENRRKLMVAHQIAKINKKTNYEKIIESFTNNEESSIKNIEIKESVEGLCIDVTDIMYSNGIYTVTFTYCYPTTQDIKENRIEDLPLYEMTIGLTINEDETYSKYCVSSKMESMLIKEGKEEIVKDVSYVEIQVDNSDENGLSYTKPLRIENQQIIDEIKNTINNGEKVIIQSAGGFWESCPILTIYQENGETLTVVAIDGFEMEGEPSGNLIAVSKKRDQSDKVIYKVDKELGAYTERTYDNNMDFSGVDNYFVLYNGVEIEKKTGIQDVFDMEITDEAIKKYNRTYYNYEKGKYFYKLEGTFGEETYEGYSVVITPKRIAISERYNAIPREYETIEELPEELIDMADCSSVDIQAIDLDGDGKKEYIVCWTVDYAEGDIGDGEPQASSGIMLLDENYKKVADLVTLYNGFWGNIKEEDHKRFLLLDNVEYIDIDNDGNMEIIIEIPQYEGYSVSIIKYKNGTIEGETDIKASVEA